MSSPVPALVRKAASMLVTLMLLLPLRASAQGDRVEEHVKSVPKIATVSVPVLANYLAAPFDSDSLKFRALAIWVADNIRYDMRASRRGRQNKTAAGRVLRRRKAVCSGYSNLLVALCEAVGLECTTIEGYSKGIYWEPDDILVGQDHSWNAVKLDGRWQLIDPTWMAGFLVKRRQYVRQFLLRWFQLPFETRYRFVSRRNERYYLAHPDTFLQDHLPVHVWWQLKTNPVPVGVFEADTVRQWLQSGQGGFYPFSDSIAYWMTAETPEKWLQKGKSGFWANPNNHLVLAQGHNQFGLEWALETLEDHPDPETAIIILDSCKVHLKEGIRNFKQHRKDLNQARKRSRYKNRAFNREYRRSAAQVKKENRKAIRGIAKQRQKLATESARLRQQVRKLEAFNGQLKYNSNQVARLEGEVLSSSDSLRLDSMRSAFAGFADSLGLLQAQSRTLFEDSLPFYYQNSLRIRYEVATSIGRNQSSIQTRTALRAWRNWNWRQAALVRDWTDTIANQLQTLKDWQETNSEGWFVLHDQWLSQTLKEDKALRTQLKSWDKQFKRLQKNETDSELLGESFNEMRTSQQELVQQQIDWYEAEIVRIRLERRAIANSILLYRCYKRIQLAEARIERLRYIQCNYEYNVRYRKAIKPTLRLVKPHQQEIEFVREAVSWYKAEQRKVVKAEKAGETYEPKPFKMRLKQ